MPTATSSPQTVPTQQVYDYLLDPKGAAVKGVQVTVTLDMGNATTITPQVALAAISVTATTDSNGFWTVSLIPNANISPANSTYSVQVPGYDVYEINIPSAGGPFQSTSLTVLVV